MFSPPRHASLLTSMSIAEAAHLHLATIHNNLTRTSRPIGRSYAIMQGVVHGWEDRVLIRKRAFPNSENRVFASTKRCKSSRFISSITRFRNHMVPLMHV